MNPFSELMECGQSFWMDNLTRGKIKSGELKYRIEHQELRGITSNPAIFYKAISSSKDYDNQIAKLARKGLRVDQIYEQLVITDIQEACDLLKTVYDRSKGTDGFVSLEVSPYLAHLTEETTTEARRLFEAVSRPNVLIKIPATPECIPAIEEMLYEGINVNITLLFSVKTYEAVANAYIRALERRTEEGKPVERIASVASFFLSRIDVLADQLLGHRIGTLHTPSALRAVRPELLMGRLAIASARLAYQRFKEIFRSGRWKRLERKGARIQRLLWASTSTKNPLYPDGYYVEPLIGPHTVNTMPDETIEAFSKRGIVVKDTIEADLRASRKVFSDMKKLGLDPEFIARRLQEEGIQKFIDPFDQLMKLLAQKVQYHHGKAFDPMDVGAGKLDAPLEACLSALESRRFPQRLHGQDPLLWSERPSEQRKIQDRLGWLTSPEEFIGKVSEIEGFARNIKKSGFQDVVLLGMGGSSLCPQVCMEIFGSAKGWPRLLVLDDTDPSSIIQLEEMIDPARTLFIVASKSGTTTETISLYRYFFERLKSMGAGGDRFIAITDPGSPLAREAAQKGFRKVFENPPRIGGRYSALSYFGLVPMALIGINIGVILERAHRMQNACGASVPARVNPGIRLGAFLGLNHNHGLDKVTLLFSDHLSPFGAWAEQLIAESTGKDGRGLIPVDGEMPASSGRYGHDRLFIYMRLGGRQHPSLEKMVRMLQHKDHPVARIEVSAPENLGEEFYRWEIATATAAALIGVNPFDEPNVSESKKNTRNLLIEWKGKGGFPEQGPAFEKDGITLFYPEDTSWAPEMETCSMEGFLRSFLGTAAETDYIALLPYFQPASRRHGILQSIRTRLRNRLKVATTIGYGPRYLHSTGQLHKGGPNRGIFLIFTARPPKELPIPGEPYGFAVLQHAQALGDFHSLARKGRRVIRFHFEQRPEKGLRLIAKMLG